MTVTNGKWRLKEGRWLCCWHSKIPNDQQGIGRARRGVDGSAVAQAVRRFAKWIQEDSRLDRAFKILQEEVAAMSYVKMRPHSQCAQTLKLRVTGRAELDSVAEKDSSQAMRPAVAARRG
jgi:hypothetical protein